MFTPNSQSGDTSGLPRTSPRKAGVPAIDLDKVNPQERFSWDSEKTRQFLQVLVQEIEQEGCTTLGFDSAAWNRMATMLSDRIKEQVSKKQCTNKYDDLRKEWKAWDFLLNVRSLTGLGRDPNTGTITAPNHQWKQWISHDKKVAKFRKKPLEHPELMERVFRKATRTTKGVYTAGGDNTQFFEVNDSETSSNAEKGIGEDDAGLDPFESPQSDLGNPRLQLGSTSKGKKRKKLSTSERLSQSVCNFVEEVKTSIKNTMVIEHKHDSYHSIISYGMNILHEMEVFKDPANRELKMWVVALLESNPANWSVFSKLKSNGERMHWLQRQHIQARLAFQRSGAIPGGDEPPPGIFPPPPYDDFDLEEVGRPRNFTGLSMHGMEGMSLNNIQARNSTWEGGGNSGSHQNIWEFPTEVVQPRHSTWEEGGNSGNHQKIWEFPTEVVQPRNSIWEEGGNSGSHQNIWEFPTEEGDMAAYALEIREEDEIENLA